MTGASPGTTITRVFHRRPRVAMHHQRSACEAMTSPSMDHASSGGTSGRRTQASTSIATRKPECSTTMNG